MPFDNAANISIAPSGGTFTASYTMGSVSGGLLLVFVGYNRSTGSAAVTAMTFNGVSMTSLGATVLGNVVGELWYLLAPASGTHNVVVTLDSSKLEWVGIGALSWSGVNQANPDLGYGAGGSASGSTNSSEGATLASSRAQAALFLFDLLSGSIGVSTWSNPTVITNTGYSGGAQNIPGFAVTTAFIACSYGPWPGGTATPKMNTNRGANTYGFVGLCVPINESITTQLNVSTVTYGVTDEPVTETITVPQGTPNYSYTPEPPSFTEKANLSAVNYALTYPGINPIGAVYALSYFAPQFIVPATQSTLALAALPGNNALLFKRRRWKGFQR